MISLQVGDRVRRRNGLAVMVVADVYVPGWSVFPPSTYAVELETPHKSAHPDPLIVGDAYLELVSRG